MIHETVRRACFQILDAPSRPIGSRTSRVRECDCDERFDWTSSTPFSRSLSWYGKVGQQDLEDNAGSVGLENFRSVWKSTSATVRTLGTPLPMRTFNPGSIRASSRGRPLPFEPPSIWSILCTSEEVNRVSRDFQYIVHSPTLM
jgi:hypothetical protein